MNEKVLDKIKNSTVTNYVLFDKMDKVTRIPSELISLNPNVEHLSFYCCKEDLDLTGIHKFNNLKKLSVIGTEKTPLTVCSLEEISKVKSLEELSLGNLVSEYDISKSIFSSLINLKILNISSWDKVILDGIENLESLESLEITNCKLSIYQFAINKLNSLKKLANLNLSSNILTSIKGICNSSISHFNISNNLLVSLEGIEGLDRLTNLDASRNKIFNINNLSNHPYLKVLNLHKNNLTSLKKSSNIKNLIWLDVSNNKLESLEGISFLKQLTYLDISLNSINSLKEIEKLSSLKSLFASSNNITTYKELLKLKKLTHIGMNYNKISSIKDFFSIKSLERVELICNEIKETKISINDLLKSSFSLIEIYTKGRLREYDPDPELKWNSFFGNEYPNFVNIQVRIGLSDFKSDLEKGILNLSKCGLTEIPSISSSFAKAVKILDLSSNKIKNLKGISQFTNLRVLKLDNNIIKNIPALIKKLTNLEELSIANNHLKNLENLDTLPNLKFLNLESNLIRDITALKALINLEFLNLDNNYLNSIELLGDLKNLKKLILSNNHLKEISAVENNSSIQELYLCNNFISEFNASKMSSLIFADLELNTLKSFTGIEELKALKDYQKVA